MPSSHSHSHDHANKQKGSTDKKQKWVYIFFFGDYRNICMNAVCGLIGEGTIYLATIVGSGPTFAREQVLGP